MFLLKQLSIKKNDKRGPISKLSTSQIRKIHKKIYNNRHLTCHKIKSDLNLNVHFNTVYNIIRLLGWKKINTKFCQAVSEKNRVERYFFCKLSQSLKEDFSNLLFEDEVTIELRYNSRKKWHLKFSYENLK